MKARIAGGVLLVALLSGVLFLFFLRQQTGTNSVAQDEIWFDDVTDRVGVDFVHDAGDVRKYQLPQIHGSGVAVFDFDQDGWPDLYFLTFGGAGSKSINRLYRNMGDGTFKDVTEGSGLGIAGLSTGVAIADVNNDGWPDVLVAQHRGIKLFLNNGNGTFTDVTRQAGLENRQWSASASFFDFDRDGWLDLVLVCYLDDDGSACRDLEGKKDFCGPLVYPSTVTKLFRNLGSKGPAGGVRFEDVTVSAGLAKAPGPGLGVYCADFNGDGWPDIFIANDGKPNHLWINQKSGTFTEEAFARGIAVSTLGQAQAGMGVAVGDVDGNGMFDVYVTHLGSEHNTLWLQGPERGMFHDQTARAGLLGTFWRGTGFGTLMGDFDQDGWPDIAVVNGQISRVGNTTPNPALGEVLERYSERNQLFRNEGKGKFNDISRKNFPLCGTPNIARGLAAGDLNGDGALDLVLTTVAGPARVYFNVAKARGHWLIVRALDPRLKRDAYGAEVTLRAGDRRLLRIINPADSYQSSSDPRAHFGLGEHDHYDSIHVLWPDGRSEVFSGGTADRRIILRRGEGTEEQRGTSNGTPSGP